MCATLRKFFLSSNLTDIVKIRKSEFSGSIFFLFFQFGPSGPGNIGRYDSLYWFGHWDYIYPYCPEDEAKRVCKDPVENFVVAALGNTPDQESNTKRVKFQYSPF